MSIAQKAKCRKLTGIPASDGYAVCKVIKYIPTTREVTKKVDMDIETEINRFEEAISISQKEIEKLIVKTAKEIDDEHSLIFEAHKEILNDPELIGAVKSTITTDKVNAEYALNEVANQFISVFEAMDNEYIKERAADIKDVSGRILDHLLGNEKVNLSKLDEEVIVIAKDLTPSDTALMDKDKVRAFVTEMGGRTSHSVIMARSLQIPAIVGVENLFDKVQQDDIVIVDGIQGVILINPDEEVMTNYQKKVGDYLLEQKELKLLVSASSQTNDGQKVEIAANIGSPEDVKFVLENGADGIGLFRTEFLYMGRDTLPTEEEQLKAYSEVLTKMAGKPVVIRTLDIGGDKELPYLSMDKELNPFLGVRAIRMCFEQEQLFRTQLRALLRASTYGNLKIMFPMIATLEEWRKAKDLLLSVQSELIDEGYEISSSYQVGMMVEIPSAVMLADQFAKEVDFFSIGTNDLIQYTFAADRMNEKLSYLYQPFNPGLILMIMKVIEAAHGEGKWVGMCGEMASEVLLTPLLIGLGLDEFSMSATSILNIRKTVRQLYKDELKSLTEEILAYGTEQEVMNRLRIIEKEIING